MSYPKLSALAIKTKATYTLNTMVMLRTINKPFYLKWEKLKKRQLYGKTFKAGYKVLNIRTK
jgi:hypothetical protein